MHHVTFEFACLTYGSCCVLYTYLDIIMKNKHIQPLPSALYRRDNHMKLLLILRVIIHPLGGGDKSSNLIARYNKF